jgi:hypothetical protein
VDSNDVLATIPSSTIFERVSPLGMTIVGPFIGGKQTTVLVWTFGLCPLVRRLFLVGGNSACLSENELGSGTGAATV